jgi:hypothetical protein
MKVTIVKFSSLFMAIMLMSGCDSQLKFVIPDPSVTTDGKNEPIPLNAGLFLSEEIKSYEWRAKAGAYPCCLEMGKALSNGAEATVRKAFNHVVVLDSPDAKQAKENILVIIYPEIIAVEGVPVATDSGVFVRGFRLKCQVKIKWTIKSRDGKIIFMNTFTGEENWPHGAGNPCKKIYETFNKAVEQHFNNALTGILSSPWWKLQGNQ